MKKYILVIYLAISFCQAFGQQNLDLGMNGFLDSLMAKMTLEEKIGQLNLVTPGGGILTGSVVSTDVEQKIREGAVGGIFGIYGPERILKAQKMVVEQSRMGIPLLFGSDIIHGYKTTFPLPLGLSCSWDLNLINKTARIAAKEATADGVYHCQRRHP